MLKIPKFLTSVNGADTFTDRGTTASRAEIAIMRCLSSYDLERRFAFFTSYGVNVEKSLDIVTIFFIVQEFIGIV